MSKLYVAKNRQNKKYLGELFEETEELILGFTLLYNEEQKEELESLLRGFELVEVKLQLVEDN